ncbi:hypothetical protein Sjap_000362 [Stephania japonica]|uniref:MLO-like protein n=1 Tax=Stephania japonica TaxID=461633 RepID=A0AAP0KKA1_9MAGN
MAGGGAKGAGSVASLDETPTWAIAAVCFVLIAISISIEHVLRFIAKLHTAIWVLLISEKRKALTQALHKVESELMLFGFVSLLLEVTKKPISKICVPPSVADTFLPCNHYELSSKIDEETQCKHQGKISLMSGEGVDQLQILIFVFAFVLVLSSLLTFGLGMAKAHFTGDGEFNFQKFLRRTLDRDFQVVVGVSAWNWMFTVVFIFFKANGFKHHMWLPFIPLAFLCGYVTLPLYALVTQMGTSMKKAVFTEHVVVGLKNWHATAKAKVIRSNGMNLTAARSTASSSSTITRSSSFEDYEIEMQPQDQPSRAIQHVSVEITEEKVHTDQSASFKFW